jgi:hypothetical protein
MCFRCMRTGERKCDGGCGICDDCPDEVSIPNGMTEKDYQFSED